MSVIKDVEIFSDGACSCNPGPGGWGTILRYMGQEREICGGERTTTNNRMELTAVIKGLNCLKERCRVKIYTDSQYIANGINKGWAVTWKKNGWIKSDKKKAQNSDLWDELLTSLSKHDYEIIWLRGHSGHIENERCDTMAVAQSRLFANSTSDD